jgi:hypothetical protein
VPRYWFESRRYFHTSHGRLYTLLADVAWVTGFICGGVPAGTAQAGHDPLHLLSDFLRYNFLASRPQLGGSR